MRYRQRRPAALAALASIALAACVETGPACKDHPSWLRPDDGGACVDPAALDASTSHDGGDATTPRDAGGPCGVCADPDASVCLVPDGGNAQCVQCITNGDCSGDTPACGPDHTCAQCVMDGDCMDPAAAHCMGGTCMPCTMSDQCTGTGSATVCDTSQTPATCVDCTASDGCTTSQTCNLFTNTCDNVMSGSRMTCQSCTSDAQCHTGDLCVVLNYMGTADTVGHCLQMDSGGSCSSPYRTPIHRRTVSSTTQVDFCGIEESMTTCEAILALQADADCTMDGACSEAGGPSMPVPGAICGTVSMAANKCTYACEASLQCPSFAPCGASSGYCGGA